MNTMTDKTDTTTTLDTKDTKDQSYRAALETYIATHAKPTHKFGHQPRLYALTQQIGQGLTYDDDVVFAAVWLHDLGVFVGHRPEDEVALKTWDHVAYAIEKTPALLTEFCFPEEKITAVLEVIRTHQPHDKPLTIEATIARDADILEQLGAIGITRTLAKLGSDTRFETFTEAHTALKKHLTNLPSQLLLETSKVLAAPRIATMQTFLDALESEAGPNLY
ncbi:HD domain-containing protein [Tunturibacter psychrotolerans]|uniref:HD domain-containing protein n=1 Tax=Tunturiibacter psychrotolerans TaxID=3069686 RepID=A0AAU7ZMT2_9BACT